VVAMVDTIRAVAAYGIAAGVVAAGIAIIYLSRDEPAASDLRVLIAGFIGSSLTFVYGQEVQTRTARQAASQTLASATAQTVATDNASGRTGGPSARAKQD
jgi:hypothetical protein